MIEKHVLAKDRLTIGHQEVFELEQFRWCERFESRREDRFRNLGNQGRGLQLPLTPPRKIADISTSENGSWWFGQAQGGIYAFGENLSGAQISEISDENENYHRREKPQILVEGDSFKRCSFPKLTESQSLIAVREISIKELTNSLPKLDPIYSYLKTAPLKDPDGHPLRPKFTYDGEIYLLGGVRTCQFLAEERHTYRCMTIHHEDRWWLNIRHLLHFVPLGL